MAGAQLKRKRRRHYTKGRFLKLSYTELVFWFYSDKSIIINAY